MPLHINILELSTAGFTLRCFTQDLMGNDVFLRVDNTTELAYINKHGGIQSEALQKESRFLVAVV